MSGGVGAGVSDGPGYPIRCSGCLLTRSHMNRSRRNEAHRFGIEHHRNRRSKSALKSELESIPGIGDKTRIQLLQAFKSAQRVSFAKLDELEHIVGKSKAQKIYNFYNNKK